MGRFSNKVVIVTGSSTGIGQACAILFAKEGGKVTITGRSEKTLAETRQQLERIGTSTENYLTLTGDIQNELFRAELIKKTIEKWGRLDVLVNNAGVSNKPGCDIDSLETFDYVFSINVRSLYDLTVLALPHILKTKGNVVSVSSICSFRPFTSCNFYCMAKAAVDQFTRAFAVQHAPKGIRFNNVNPGFTKTPVFSKNQHADTVSVSSERRQSFNQFEHEFISEAVPQGRMATCPEMAEAVAFLASDQASYVNGTCLVVDGAFSIRSPEKNSREVHRSLPNHSKTVTCSLMAYCNLQHIL